MLSIIIPTYNELKNDFLQKSLPLIHKIPNTELIIVDSYSTDGTLELVKKYSSKVIQVKTTSRAHRINKGVEQARGATLLIHHPRSIIESKGIEHLTKTNVLPNWGAFTHRFDHAHPLLKFTSFYSNKIRGDFFSIYYLDHCIYLTQNLAQQVFPIPEVDIFEDTLLCQKLKKISKGVRLPHISETSAVRFKKNGIWPQAIKNQILKLRFYINFNHTKMNKEYEKELGLNSDYERDK